MRGFVEAHAALRLLLLDHNCPDGDTLELPFPSQNEVRYPQLVLSEAFLKTPESKLGLDQDVRQWLMPVVSIAPPSLLRRLAERALAARADGRLPKTSRLALDFVLCLQAGDRPREALPLVLKIVLENRDDSSWHRILFSKGYLERLCAQDARDAVQGLAREILARTGVPSTQPNTDGPASRSRRSSCLPKPWREPSMCSIRRYQNSNAATGSRQTRRHSSRRSGGVARICLRATQYVGRCVDSAARWIAKAGSDLGCARRDATGGIGSAMG